MTEHDVTQGDRLAAKNIWQIHLMKGGKAPDWLDTRLAAHRIATEAAQKQKADALAEALREWREYDDLDEADFANIGPMLHYANAIEKTRAALAAYEGEV